MHACVDLCLFRDDGAASWCIQGVQTRLAVSHLHSGKSASRYRD